MAAVANVSLSGNTYIDALLSGYRWAAGSLTYSFPTSGSYYGPSYGDGENANSFGAFNAAQQSATRAALKLFASVANLSFMEIGETATQHADLRFALSNLPSTAWAYFPTTAVEGGDAWFNRSSGSYSTPVKGNYAYLTFVHEIGHALGLEHAHEGIVMPQNRDSIEYTIMSYRSYVGASTTSGYVNETWGYAQSLMMYDIAALQRMYGANYTTNSSNTVYSWSPTTGEMFINGIGQGAAGGNRIFQTVWDGGGSDTYDFSKYSTGLKISLEPGAWTTTSAGQLAKLHWSGSKMAVGNIATALLYNGDQRSLIESAIGGSGNDIIVGNQASNTLKGGAGNDTLTGARGNDLLDGGAGSDTVVFGGQRSSYAVTLLADGSLQVADLRSGAPDGKDTILNTEWFKFTDKVYSVNELKAANQAAVTETAVVTTSVPVAQDIVFRFYNMQTGTHFYTASEAERDYVMANLPIYSYEGNAFDAQKPQEADVDVFRFYNTKTGTHFYTASEEERDYVMTSFSQFSYEGVAYGAYETDGGGEHTALYRFYNEQTGTHFHTADETERTSVINSYPQFKYEGIAYYVDFA